MGRKFKKILKKKVVINFKSPRFGDVAKVYANTSKLKKLINCPSCNSLSVTKSLMTPNLSSKSNIKKTPRLKKAMVNDIKKYKKIIEKNFDYVGDNFTEEAKKMKYGEIDERPIYGEATLEQTKELFDEDIGVVPLPWSSTKKIN